MNRPVHPARAVRAAGLAALAAAALLLCSAGPVVQVDSIWVAPGLRADHLYRIAVLPVVRLAGEPEVAHQVASGWLDHNPAAGGIRLDEVQSVLRLEGPARERDSLLARAAQEIAAAGGPAPATARWFARRLGATALVALRVDRWEAGSGVQDMAYVDLTATLVDSAGSVLWRGAGRARAEAARPPAHFAALPVPAVSGEGHARPGGSATGSGSSSVGSSGSSSGSSTGAQTGGGSSSSSPVQTTPAGAGSASNYRPQLSPVTGPQTATRQADDEWIREERRQVAPFAAALDTLLSALAARLPAGPRR